MKNSFKVLFLVLLLALSKQALAYQQDYLPTDPNLIYQNYFGTINAKSSWSNELLYNKEVVVAVLDSGVDLSHPDLVDNLWVNTAEIPDDGIDNDNNSYIDDVVGWDFLDSDNNPRPDLDEGYDFTAINHGTVIAGIIAATANDAGILGLAPKAKIMPLKILDAKGSGNTLVLSQAINYAVENGADIINLSLVGKSFDNNLKQAIVNAYAQGVMIVAASGNETNIGQDLDLTPSYPVCDFDEVNRVLGVAALDQDKVLANFSNYGEKCIDVSAPGVNIYSTMYHDDNDTNFANYYRGGWSGTSVAAPMVSATLALLKMQYPDWQVINYYNLILENTDSLQASNTLKYKDLGRGLLDVGKTLEAANRYYNQAIKIVLAPQTGLQPEVLIMDDRANLQKSFLAYDKKFKGGVALAVGDVDGDGSSEIVTAPQAGGGPHVRIFNSDGVLKYEFFAYPNNVQTGLNLAVGDLDQDGRAEIVVAPQVGGGPHVKVFKYDGELKSQFFAYNDKFRGGVNLSIGDINNDGLGDIVTAPVSNSDPQLKVFSNTGLLLYSWLAYDKKLVRGMQVAVGDIDNDKWVDIITTPAKGYQPQVKVFDFSGKLKSDFIAYSRYLTGGIKIIARDISGDTQPEILALPNKGNVALLRIYDAKGLEKNNFYLRSPYDKNGYNLEVLVK